MKRRVSFKNNLNFVHMMATKDLDAYKKPNVVASIFMLNSNDVDKLDDLPNILKHYISYDPNDTEKDEAKIGRASCRERV
mgnify:CR=1 FL=1